MHQCINDDATAHLRDRPCGTYSDYSIVSNKVSNSLATRTRCRDRWWPSGDRRGPWGNRHGASQNKYITEQNAYRECAHVFLFDQTHQSSINSQIRFTVPRYPRVYHRHVTGFSEHTTVLGRFGACTILPAPNSPTSDLHVLCAAFRSLSHTIDKHWTLLIII
jgi:hypothetical protein